MKAYVNLFKALPVEARTKSFSTKYIDKGVLVEDSVIEAHGTAKVSKLVRTLVPTDSQMNKTFHKSWKKVRDASIEQLVIEQIIHYFTTYGFEAFGFYNEDSVYIPNEKLELDAKGGITFYVLRGITQDELAKAVNRIISSGMALSDQDLTDLVKIIKDRKLQIDPATSSNREMAVRLYGLLNITPKDPVEYLRLKIYNVTESTLLIKNTETVEAISKAMENNKFGSLVNVFSEYEKKFGLDGLASIFYRFKPLFLAFKNKKSASTVNKIRRLAKKHHKPVPEDYIAAVTMHLRNGTFNAKKLNKSLNKANLFRKVKLAQALQFYDNKEAHGIVYAIRNGKSFADTVNPLGNSTQGALSVVWDSLGADLAHVKGKKIFMDAGLVVPTSGKMFMGDVPFGSHFSTDDSLVLGVSWSDLKSIRVDLDLSIISVGGKIGWDGYYRDSSFLFSGDVTAAPHGATEAHLIRADSKNGIYLLNLNYYNAHDGGVVPFTLFVTKEKEYKRIDQNAVMSQDNMVFWAESSIDSKFKQKTIGILKIKDGTKTFHAFEFKTGRSITARNNEKSRNTISYYDKYLDSLLDLQTLMEWAGAKIVDTPEKADINLSLKSLTKNTLIDLLISAPKQKSL
jgi:hypothetical protein